LSGVFSGWTFSPLKRPSLQLDFCSERRAIGISPRLQFPIQSLGRISIEHGNSI
jgi:hypothetical protein